MIFVVPHLRPLRFPPFLAPVDFVAPSWLPPSACNHWLHFVLAVLGVLRFIFHRVFWGHHSTAFVHPFHLPLTLHCPFSLFLAQPFVLLRGGIFIVFDVIICYIRGAMNKNQNIFQRKVLKYREDQSMQSKFMIITKHSHGRKMKIFLKNLVCIASIKVSLTSEKKMFKIVFLYILYKHN